MNYYAARELMGPNGEHTGLFHFTCENDGVTWPVGYCSSVRTCPSCKGHAWMYREGFCAACQNKGTIRVDPCPGHPTKEEAEEHYRQYQLDGARYDGFSSNQQFKCRVCGAWTQRYAQVCQSYLYHLCDDHCTRETLEQIHPKVGWAAGSW